MGLQDCRDRVVSIPYGESFTAKDISDDHNVHSYLARLVADGLIIKLPEKVRVGSKAQSQYRRVATSDWLDPFAHWRVIWPEFFTAPKLSGVKHKYIQGV